MFDFLDNLRKKPETVRTRIAIITAGICTGIIVILWLPVVFGRFENLREMPGNINPVNEIKESFPAWNESSVDQVNGQEEDSQKTIFNAQLQATTAPSVAP
jgi:hypothetical protein